MGHHHGLKASDSLRERLVAQARVRQRLTPFALTTVDRDTLKPRRIRPGAHPKWVIITA
jgi:hypothetical protein